MEGEKKEGVHVYIPHRKYEAKPHSSPWFCAAAIAHRNTFFVCPKG